MFHHTQKALRANVSQVDVLEAGRAATDMLARELSQMSACHLVAGTNFFVTNSLFYTPVVQKQVSAGSLRTNILQEMFFLSRFDRDFVGTCYRVVGASNGVGVLCRYSTNMPATNMVRSWLTRTGLLATVMGQPAGSYSPVAEGVIHCRVRAYDSAGQVLAYYWPYLGEYRVRRLSPAGRLLQNTVNSNVILGGLPGGDTWYVFLSNALPAYVEVELGFLEPRTLTQFRSFPEASPLAASYLADRAGQVHLFRQRVPIRRSSVSSTAYQ
jgi:hypothetical protein